LAHLINPRWIDIPQEAIYQQLVMLDNLYWGCKTIYVEEQARYYLFSEDDYAYPYSLPIDVITKLAKALNGTNMTWYNSYNIQAMEYFDDYGVALNQAQEYWVSVGNKELPKPEILPVDGLNSGDEYIAIIGLFHLRGFENNNNHHLYVDYIDMNGNRIYYDPSLSIEFIWGWDGMSGEQVRSTAPIKVDKSLNEPGTNIGISWNQIVYGFSVNHIASDRFKKIHVRYTKDEEGNNDGHHSHYIVLQKRIYQGEPLPPDPDPIPDPDPDPIPDEKPVILIDKNWLDSQEIDENNYIKIYKKDVQK